MVQCGASLKLCEAMLTIKLCPPYMVHLERTFLGNADSNDFDDSIEIDAGGIVDESPRFKGRPDDLVSDTEVSVFVAAREIKKYLRPGLHLQSGP